MKMTEPFPRMIELRQNFPASPKLEFPSLLRNQFEAGGILARLAPGMRIAVGVGSRGITSLTETVKAVIGILKDAGTEPFIVPVMGSHGGATPEGQRRILAEFGITQETMGVSIEASMEVLQIGEMFDGREVVFSLPAYQADGIVFINRIKPHTDFHGNLGSGLQKMLTIGFGKHLGAANAHRAASILGHEAVIRETARVILGATKVLCGVAIIEDQYHQTADIRVVRAEDILKEEDGLFIKARSLMAGLPFDQIDLLIVDEMGKQFSGTGMDTNVIGRGVLGYSASLKPDNRIKPQIFRIFLRDLSVASNGNGVGIGLADFTTSRAVKALNLQYTYINTITGLGLPVAKIPIYFDTDREVLKNAFASLVYDSPAALRVVHIANTLNLDRMLVSESLIEEANGRAGLNPVGTAKEMEFDGNGNLLPI